jgi:hypothetical protein
VPRDYDTMMNAVLAAAMRARSAYFPARDDLTTIIAGLIEVASGLVDDGNALRDRITQLEAALANGAGSIAPHSEES